jgi:hypothetical protein
VEELGTNFHNTGIVTSTKFENPISAYAYLFFSRSRLQNGDDSEGGIQDRLARLFLSSVTSEQCAMKANEPDNKTLKHTVSDVFRTFSCSSLGALNARDFVHKGRANITTCG